jgi:hypothetical protein
MKHAPDLIDLIRVQRPQCSPLGRNQATQPVQEHLGIQVLAGQDKPRAECLLQARAEERRALEPRHA